MSNFNQLKDLVMGLESDFEKFYDKGNSAAGTRVRKGMQELKNLAQSIRTEVQNTKNSGGGAAAGGAGAKAGGAAKAAPAKKAAAAPAAKKAAPAKKK